MPRPQQELCKKEMTTKESSVPKPLASSRNIRVIISQNQAQMRCNRVRMSPKDFQALIGGSWRKARLPHDLKIKSSVHVCRREIENVAVISGNFEHMNCITDYSDFEAVCLNETV